ncbi:RES family NAD+ phosphorylase [Flavobacterium psychrotrophum]|uniref:RES family NAD+ phosphorylase n=1 Tax=Flavobacterium psychrotrophum TaxID=2294119 RepID=UPI000E322FC0|nr:RES family NAD+ phosphorylase [Flavobacterium psychrotrophum]
MRIYRLSKAVYANDLSGRGAEKAGGRWNSKGTAMLYGGETRALCTTEIAVHTPLGNIPLDYMLITIELPDTLSIDILEKSNLPADWKALPHAHATQLIGDAFIAAHKFVALKVPSVVVPGEYNYLLNPSHPDFKTVTVISIEPFDFDERLFIK